MEDKIAQGAEPEHGSIGQLTEDQVEEARALWLKVSEALDGADIEIAVNILIRLALDTIVEQDIKRDVVLTYVARVYDAALADRARTRPVS